MALSKSTITGRVPLPTDENLQFAELTFALSGLDTEGASVLPGGVSTRAVLVGSDIPAGFELWQNTAGLRGTHYRVLARWTVKDRDGVRDQYADIGIIQVGSDPSYTLADLINNGVPPAIGTFWSAITQAQYDAAIGAAVTAVTAKDGAIAARDSIVDLFANNLCVDELGELDTVSDIGWTLGRFAQVRSTGFWYKRLADDATVWGVSFPNGRKAEVMPNGSNELSLEAFDPDPLDATAAFLRMQSAAWAHAQNTSYVKGSLICRIPAGTLKIQPGTFSNGPSRTGITYIGAGRDNTILELIDNGVEGWFYDNGPSNPVSDRNTYRGIRFKGQVASRANGFKITDSVNKEKRFQFWECVFSDLNVVNRGDGTTNADEFSFFGCEFKRVTTLLIHNNPQQVIYNYVNCSGEFSGDMVIVDAGGGGDFVWTGGSIIHLPLVTGADKYILKGINNPATSNQNGQFTFHNTRMEMRSQYSKLVDWLVSSAPAQSRTVYIKFDNVNLTPSVQGTGSLRPDFVRIGTAKTVLFENCMFPTDISGTNDIYEFVVDSDPAYTLAPHPGLILFNNCTARSALVDDCRIANTYGRIIAKGMVSASTPANNNTGRRALDFDLGFDRAMGNACEGLPKVLNMLRNNWPLGAGGNETSFILPRGAIIRRITIFKPASSGSATVTQWRIGLDNKSAFYAETLSAASQDQHSVDVFLNEPIPASNLTLRFWSTAGTLAQTGGYALVEYI